MNYATDYKPAGPGTKGMAITALVLSGVAALSGGIGGIGLGNGLNLFGNGGGCCAWTAKEVALLEEINKVKTAQAVTAAVTPYQIDKATCMKIDGQLFMPSSEVAYVPHPVGACRGI